MLVRKLSPLQSWAQSPSVECGHLKTHLVGFVKIENMHANHKKKIHCTMDVQ